MASPHSLRPSHRLRILYSFPHPFGSTGTGSTAYNQVSGLERLGHRVTLACTSVVAGATAPEDTITTMTIGGRRIPHRLVGVERAWRWHDRRVARLLRERAREFDVVHTWPLAASKTLRTARQLGVIGAREAPNTHTAHAYEVVARECRDLGFDPPAGHSHEPNPKRLEVEQLEYELADRILVPSEYVARTFIERGVPMNRLRIHQYGSDPDRFFPRETRIGDHPFTLIFVGRCEPRKGLHYALRAWSSAGAGKTDGRFLIYGSFMRGYRDHLGQLLDQPGVEVMGFANDVPELMRSADALVLPSVEEGSALVSYEAMASGCIPLVSTAVGARCVDQESGLLHEPGDWRLLSEQIRALSEDVELRAELKRGAARRGAELTWNKAAEVLTECYGHVASGSIRPS